MIHVSLLCRFFY